MRSPQGPAPPPGAEGRGRGARRWIGLAALGLAWRLGLAWPVYQSFRPGTSAAGDANLYLALAENLLAGHGYTIDPTPPHEPFAFRPPAYPLFLAGVLFAGGGSHAAVVIAQVLLDLATGFLLALLARRLWPERPRRALLAFALWATCPAVGSLAGRFLAEVLATFLVTAGLLLLASATGRGGERRAAAGSGGLAAAGGGIATSRGGMAAAVGGGAALMLAVLARPQLVPVLLLLPFFGLAFRRPGVARAPLVIAALLGLLLVEAPWVIRNQRALGEPVLLSHGLGELVLAMGVLGEPRGETAAAAEARLRAEGLEVVRDPAARHRDRERYLRFAIERVRENPLRFLKISLRRAVLLWITPRTAVYGVTPDVLRHALQNPAARGAPKALLLATVFGLYYLGLLALAALGAWRARHDRALWAILLALPVGVTLTIMWLYLEARNLVPTYPAVVLAAAIPLAERLEARDRRRREAA